MTQPRPFLAKLALYAYIYASIDIKILNNYHGIVLIFSKFSQQAATAMANLLIHPLIKRTIMVSGMALSFLHLLCSMGLLSAIIIWLSLEFTAPLPSTLAFIIGIPCLGCTVAAILMFGVPRKEAFFAVIFIVLSTFIVLAGVSILGPFINLYTHEQPDLIGDFCNDCMFTGNRTESCIDSCHDECCFTNYSAPLVTVFIAFTSTALAVSVAAVLIGIVYLCTILSAQPEEKQKQ